MQVGCQCLLAYLGLICSFWWYQVYTEQGEVLKAFAATAGLELDQLIAGLLEISFEHRQTC